MSVSNCVDWPFHKGRPVLIVDQIISSPKILNWIKKREEPEQTFNVSCLLVVDAVWPAASDSCCVDCSAMKAYSPELWLEINPISPDLLLSGYFLITIGKGSKAGIKIKTPKCEPFIRRVNKESVVIAMSLLTQKWVKTEFSEHWTLLSLYVVTLTWSTKCWSMLKTLWILFLMTNSFKWYYKNIKKLIG